MRDMTQSVQQRDAQQEEGQATQTVGAGRSAVATASEPTATRASQIVRVSAVGIVANVLLAVFKAIVGLAANSIAIVLDAVNNLSDAGSSVITIVGTKLADRAPDRKHPFGYGRVEYLTTIIIAVIVLWAGITSLRESVTRIVHPEDSTYTVVSLVIVAVAVLVKVALGRYVKARGERLSSDSLVASGTDATMDAVLSAATLVAALVTVFAHVSLEAWVGAIISAFIVKAGFDILREAIGKILGERVDAGLSQQIKHDVCEVPGVRGAYDLVLNDYGPERLWGSVHVEVPETMTASEIDTITRKIQLMIAKKYNVILHTVGIYSSNVGDTRAAQIRDHVCSLALAHDGVIQVHGFYVNEHAKFMNLDVVISYDKKDRADIYGQVVAELRAAYPGYAIHVNLDADMSD